MSQKTLINGTGREITQGRTLVEGTEYDIFQGRTLVDGTGYNIFCGKPLRRYAVGESVYTYIGGVKTEFIVVQQGNPDSSQYDASCDGTWLMMKGLYNYSKWSDGDNSYNSSAVHSYLNGAFLQMIDARVQGAIKQVKIPYAIADADFPNQKLAVANGANGLATKIFLLSGAEVGWSGVNGVPLEGVCLSYFSGFASVDRKRSAELNGVAENWWLRSPYKWSNRDVWFVSDVGNHDTKTSLTGSDEKEFARPTMILPSSTMTNRKTSVIKG